MTNAKNEAAGGASRSDAGLDAEHEARLLKFMQERRAGFPAVHGELGVWKAAWYSAIDEVIAEWEKPYGLTDGRSFIDRLRSMAANAEIQAGRTNTTTGEGRYSASPGMES